MLHNFTNHLNPILMLFIVFVSIGCTENITKECVNVEVNFSPINSTIADYTLLTPNVVNNSEDIFTIIVVGQFTNIIAFDVELSYNGTEIDRSNGFDFINTNTSSRIDINIPTDEIIDGIDVASALVDYTIFLSFEDVRGLVVDGKIQYIDCDNISDFDLSDCRWSCQLTNENCQICE